MIRLFWLAVKYRKFIGLFFAVLSVIGGVYYYGSVQYSKGYDKALSRAAIAQEKADKEIREKKKDAKHKTQSLDRDSIVRELCRNGWVRDISSCE